MRMTIMKMMEMQNKMVIMLMVMMMVVVVVMMPLSVVKEGGRFAEGLGATTLSRNVAKAREPERFASMI